MEVLNRASLVLVLAGPCACTTEVFAPEDIRDPVTIHIIDYGRHAALLMPDGSGNLVKYAYGDWRWYALSDEGLWQGAAALFWPTQGALGRRGMASLSEAREDLITVRVESEKAKHLRQRLEAAYRSELSSQVFNPRYDMDFVYHSEAYSLANNSNSVVTRWLEDLGCEVRGPRILSDWELVRHD